MWSGYLSYNLQLLSCVVIRGIPISSVSCVFFVIYKSQYVSTSKLCVSIDVHFCGCEFSRVKSEKLANTLSKIHTGNRLDLETLGSRLENLQNFPGMLLKTHPNVVPWEQPLFAILIKFLRKPKWRQGLGVRKPHADDIAYFHPNVMGIADVFLVISPIVN